MFNLSHSVAVALYVLHRTMLGQQIPTMANIPLAAGEDKLSTSWCSNYVWEQLHDFHITVFSVGGTLVTDSWPASS